MRNVLRCFRTHEIGQDLIEYSLLLAFLCLSAGAVFLHAGTCLENIWNSAGSKLLMASNAASGKQASPDDAGGGGDKNKDGNPNDNNNGSGNDKNGNRGKGKGKN